MRKNNRILQVGSQQLTMEINRFCCQFVREGKLGKLKFVSAVNYTGPRRYEGLPEEPVPQGDDWNTWCGPTELRLMLMALTLAMPALGDERVLGSHFSPLDLFGLGVACILVTLFVIQSLTLARTLSRREP